MRFRTGRGGRESNAGDWRWAASAAANLLSELLHPRHPVRAIHALDPQRFDERFRRIWRTYLWSCAEVFRTKQPQIDLFQVTVSKGNVGGGYPMSRAFLYSPSP